MIADAREGHNEEDRDAAREADALRRLHNLRKAWRQFKRLLEEDEREDRDE